MKVGYELRNTEENGEGIFATKSFLKGETVMIGAITEALDANHSHASQIGEFKFVKHGGLISKVNHSCEPNCGIRVNSTGAHDFVAMRNIGENEEATFDYAMRNFTVEYFPVQCRCGASNCLGKITGWKELPEDRKTKYEGFVAPYLLAMDKNLVHKS